MTITKDQADEARRAVRINAYWAERGHNAKAEIFPTFGDESNRRVWGTKTNLKNGLPPKRVAK